jgi:hypothetical protein
MITKYWLENQKGRDHFSDLEVIVDKGKKKR